MEQLSFTSSSIKISSLNNLELNPVLYPVEIYTCFIYYFSYINYDLTYIVNYTLLKICSSRTWESTKLDQRIPKILI